MWSFIMAFQPYYILVASLGSLLGIVWGAMPGLSTTMAMAILVGLSFSMPVAVAICFMLGVFTGSVFGGAISATLMNIPGTPDNVPEQMCGFPLAKKGQGGLVLGTAITASMIGNWAGILLLILAAPMAIKFALKFASWELGLLMLWGVSIAGTLTSGQRPLKGWIAGWFGLLLSMVGQETVIGYERFTFGKNELMLGLPMIPAMIGLFGMAEVFDGLSEPTPYTIPQKVGKVFPPIRMILRYWKSIFRSTFVGLLTGIIPGCGASVATYVAYGIGQRFTGRDFSKGDFEGVICCEVADNANIGGAMLPSLVLGIPGSAPTAAFIAALGLHGIILGPSIQFEQPGLIYFVYGALIVANIAMYIGAFALIKPVVKFFTLPREALLPLIVILCVIGSYTQTLSMFDIYLTFFFGLFGYMMRRTGFPPGPLILGIILGDLMDENLRRAMVVFKGHYLEHFFSRPIGIILVIIVILTFVSGVMPSRKQRITPDSDFEG